MEIFRVWGGQIAGCSVQGIFSCSLRPPTSQTKKKTKKTGKYPSLLFYLDWRFVSSSSFFSLIRFEKRGRMSYPKKHLSVPISKKMLHCLCFPLEKKPSWPFAFLKKEKKLSIASDGISISRTIPFPIYASGEKTYCAIFLHFQNKYTCRPIILRTLPPAIKAAEKLRPPSPIY